MALPMLEAMLPLNALAQSATKARVNRMAFIFIPNGVNVDMWMPTHEGALELSPTLASMKNVKEQDFGPHRTRAHTTPSRSAMAAATTPAAPRPG